MSRDPRSVLLKPLMTEKSMQQKEELNAISFRVAVDANKGEIRQAVEGRRPGWKKAVVTLQAGHKIELVEGA